MIPARAATNLAPGDVAVIAGANGDHVRLRAQPDATSEIVAEFLEGAEVDIIAGPVTAADGSLWYQVTVAGESGYMVADYLSLAGEALNDTPPDDGDVELTAITGTATIVNTGGDPIRCRASRSTKSTILDYFYEGDPVSLTGDPSGIWQPVRCAGRNGWVSVDFISGLAGATPAPTKTVIASDDGADATTGTGVIANTNGDGARCRTKASTSGAIITALLEGAAVGVRGSVSGDWLPVVCAGQNGYIWADYVSLDPGSGDPGSGDPTTGTRYIANTNGDGIRCRKKASLDSDILTVLVAGDQVELRGAAKGEWQPIYCDGMKGYVHSEFLAESPESTPTPTPAAPPTTSLQPGDTAQVSGTNGDGVRFRSAARSDASVIRVLSEGAKVDVIAGSTGDWVAVSYRGTTGFVHTDYLAAVAATPPTGESHAGLANGDHALVTDSVNFRAGASLSADVIGIAADGIVVLVTGPVDGGYYPVQWGDQHGFMHGDYLQWTSDELSPGYGGIGGDAGSGDATPAGQAIVDYAQTYLGYPYIWATHGPDSFDCSGFTYWVIKHVLKIDIGAGTWTQISAGTPVSYGNLQPGDLVFFQNTYTWGLSHVGIYIGNNQFIHAENEETGVRISSLTSTYYSTRYYGARRLT